MSKHTPGPWSVYSGDGELDGKAKFPSDSGVMIFADADCETHAIADCSCNHTCRDEEECEANARLIAAAPDLLEALKELRQVVDFQVNPPKSNPIRIALDASRAAIAKAEGEAS